MATRSSWMILQQKAMQTLQEDLAKEQLQWKPPRYEFDTEEGVAEARHAAVLWLRRLCDQLRFHADTLCLAVVLLDAFLRLVKVKPKYVTCLALACTYLAAKICEEDELVPSVTHMVEISRPGCSVADLLRMERLVLDKLDWQIRLVTPLQFLYSLHCMLVSACPALVAGQLRLSAHRQLLGLTSRLSELVTAPQCASLAPSVLAVALLCDQLSRRALHTAPFAAAACRLIKCSAETLADGRCRVRSALGDSDSSALAPTPRAAATVAKRPRQRGDSRSFSRPAKRQLVTTALTDDIVGDIRCLYTAEEEGSNTGEDGAAEEEGPGLSADQPCSLASKTGRMSYADALRRHLPTADSVTSA